MKHKIGDRVKIKSIDWYNKNKNSAGHIRCGKKSFVVDMSEYCGQIATIIEIIDKEYRLNIDDRLWCWTDDMFEGLVEDKISFDTKYEWKHELECPEGYQFKDENGTIINATKIVLEKKKKEYPKSYKKCCEVLGIEESLWFVYEDIDGNHINPACISNYRIRNLDLYHNFEKLKICRDAYWKIAGEEMGLGKPWKPDWNNGEQRKYCIFNDSNRIKKGDWCFGHAILAFPTEEMRDAFKENFDPDIEFCKELL